MGARPLRRNCGLGFVERHDLRIDARLAHAPRDELRDLTAEIDDEDADLLGLTWRRAVLRRT